MTLRLLYHLPLRQAEGFLHALFEIMRLDLSVPDYTTLSRRSQHLRRCPPCFAAAHSPALTMDRPCDRSRPARASISCSTARAAAGVAGGSSTLASISQA